MIFQTQLVANKSQQPAEVLGLYLLERNAIRDNPLKEQGAKSVAAKG
jgi:hypothetical protein